jgi:TPR repeat protein
MNILALFLVLASSALTSLPDSNGAHAAYQRGDYSKAMTLSVPLAEAGDGDALGNIGNMYAFGWGVPVDEAKGLSYWRKATEKHVPSAFGNIAVFYMQGRGGLTQDTTQAATWFLKAAEHRHVVSMISLSGMYDQGIGIGKNKSRALAWAGLAVTNAPNAALQSLARAQLNRAASDATPEEMAQGQKLIFELIEIINPNIAAYKNGG